MKNYKKRKITQDYLCSITCDCCKTEYFNTEMFEIEEFLCLEKMAGYVSIFGDGNLIQLDLCQRCVKKLLGKYIRIEERTI